MVSVLITLVLLTCVVSLAGSNQQTCLDMHTFSNTYTAISTTVQTLEAEVKRLKAQLDATIENACGEIGPDTAGQPYRFNMTYCDFEDGHMCNFTNEIGNHANWGADAGISDHTYMIPGGHTLRSGYYRYSSTDKITSRPFDRALQYCIRFFMKASTAATQFKVYLKEDNGIGYPIYSASPSPTDWTLVEISPDQEYLSKPFKLTFEFSGTSTQYVYVDDLMVYNAPCNTLGIRKPAVCAGKEVTFGSTKHCYTFHIEPKSYMDAIRTCKKVWPLSHLVAVTNDSVQHNIVSWIRNSSALQQTGTYGFWTSGQDIKTEGQFFWTTSAGPVHFNHTNWHIGQPNNVGGNQDCVLLQYSTDNYKWGDVSCSERHPFICEEEYSAN